MKLTVRKEWLCNEDGSIAKMTLREWVEYFKITPTTYTYEETGNTYELYKSETKKERNGYIDIYKLGGYGLTHAEYSKYMDKVFRTGNADFDVKLVEVDE